MAEATYYFTEWLVEQWTDPDNMVDNNLGTFASTAVDGTEEYLVNTTCDGTDLGTITKVEVRCYGYGDGDDRIDIRVLTTEHQIVMPGSAGWSGYVDVTAARAWTWDIVNTGWIYVQFDKVSKGNTMHCAKVEIRVTYTPPGPPGKPTQYMAGLDCPEFPHEMDLESDKLPCPIGAS